jgi:hypothetical protein
VLQQHHERLKTELAQSENYRQKKDPMYSASGQAMMDAARYLRSVIFRALDFLPPGESTLADYAGAVMAVQQISYPGDDFYRQWLKEEFTQRAIVSAAEYLGPDAWQSRLPPEYPPGVGLAELAQDEAAGMRFVELNQAWLGMPALTFQQKRFALRPRLRAAPQGLSPYVILKVMWEEREANPLSGSFPSERWVRMGTTVIFDEGSGKTLARLSCATPTEELYPEASRRSWQQAVFEARQQATTRYLARLAAAGQLVSQALAPKFSAAAGLDEEELAQRQLAQIAVVYSEEGGAMRAAGTGSGLHEWE